MFLPTKPTDRQCNKQRGLTLIELIIFMVIVGAAVAGVMITYSTVVSGSPDPIERKQALTLAQSLLLEIESQAFTYCDPSDANFLTATSGAGCALPANNQDNLPSVSGNRQLFNNVGDYANYFADPLTDRFGNYGITGYSGRVQIEQVGGTAPFTGIPTNDVLKITVTVKGPLSETIELTGYRTRYAPHLP